MNTTHSTPSKGDLTSTRVMAALLERLERSATSVDAQQYQSLVRRLSDALGQMDADAGRDALLAEFPATSQLYENLQYRHAGLCRSPLDAALATERQALQLIARVRGQG